MEILGGWYDQLVDGRDLAVVSRSSANDKLAELDLVGRAWTTNGREWPGPRRPGVARPGRFAGIFSPMRMTRGLSSDIGHPPTPDLSEPLDAKLSDRLVAEGQLFTVPPVAVRAARFSLVACPDDRVWFRTWPWLVSGWAMRMPLGVATCCGPSAEPPMGAVTVSDCSIPQSRRVA